METRGTAGEETTSYWFDLPIEVAEFEEKLGVGAESGDYRIIEKVLPYADEVHEHTSVYQLNELDFMYRQLSHIRHITAPFRDASDRNRTNDTGIFSPLLYRLSYRGIEPFLLAQKWQRPGSGSNRRPPA